MKLGILGTGKIVQDMLPMLRGVKTDGIYLFATERSHEKAEQLCAQFHLNGIFTDYEALLASDIDTVYVALPNSLHFSFAEKALLAGKHVILEKPAVPRLAELEQLAALAAERRLILLEAMSTWQLPAFKVLKQQLPRVGRVRLVSFNFSQYSSRYDAFKNGITQPAFDPQKAGGALMDLNVYNISAIVSLFGMPQSFDYSANIECGIDTSGILMMDYGDFKAVSIAAKDCGAPVSCTIQGDRGCLRFTTPANMLSCFEFCDNKGTTEVFEFPEEHRMLPEFKAFADIIDEKRYFTADALLKDTLAVCEIMEAARKKAGIVFAGD